MNQQEKVEYLRELAGRRPDLRIFIETGLYGRRGSGTSLTDRFDWLYAIDLDPDNCEHAEGYTRAVCGDSAVELPRLLARLTDPALFWLDAHLLVEYDDEDACPLIAELQAIVAWPEAHRSIIAIDDIRLLSDRASGYPTLDEVRAVVAGVGWIEEAGDDVFAFVSR